MNRTRMIIVAALALIAFAVAAAPSADAATWPAASMPKASFTSTARYSGLATGLGTGLGLGLGTGLGTLSGGGSVSTCGISSGNEGQGGTAGNETVICNGAGGLTFVGPQIGQVANVIGPTIIGSVVNGSVITSAGAAAANGWG